MTSSNSAAPSSRLHLLIYGPSTADQRERPAFIGLLLVSALLYLANITVSGWANSFYSAAVQAGSSNWEAFFYGSSDAANFITVDKPPASLWIMDLSVRLFGLSSFSILLPESLMGIATVAVTYLTVRRVFSWQTATLAGALVALTPVAAVMFRFNNPDALLALLMSLAIYFTLRGIQSGHLRWILWAGVAVGFGFLTKQLQAVVILPALAGVYLAVAPGNWWRRIWHLLLAMVAVVVSAGWWVAIVELVPASDRPFIGGSQTNDFLELTFGYNGLGRIDGSEIGSIHGPAIPAVGTWGPTGILRMFQDEIGGQISWLIPAALVLTVVALFLIRGNRTDLRRASLLLFASTLVVIGLTFSFAQGIFHAYYTVALAAPIAGATAIGASVLWAHKEKLWARIIAAVVVLGTVALTFLLLTEVGEWLPALRFIILVVGVIAAILLLLPQQTRLISFVTILATLVACLIAPGEYTLSAVMASHTGSVPTAGPALQSTLKPIVSHVPTPPKSTLSTNSLLGATFVSAQLASLLEVDAGSYTWVGASVGSNSAASFQLATQDPVMAIGGFNGSDPAPTLARFKAYVAAHKIHYFLGGMIGPANGGSDDSVKIADWVANNYTMQTVGGVTVYDLTP